jgi:hypothetical protein
MIASNNSDEVQSFEKLDDLLARLAGGDAEIGELNSWFMSAEWEARMASDDSALRLGWRIQSLLYQWEDFPESISADWILKCIHEVVEREGLESRLPMYVSAYRHVGSHRYSTLL